MDKESDRYDLEKIKERLDGAGLPQLGLPNLIEPFAPGECDIACDAKCLIACAPSCINGGSTG